MKNHTETSKTHIGCKAAELERQCACIKSMQWKASVQNQNRHYLYHLSPEHGAVKFPPISLLSDNLRTFHIIWGVKIHVTILGTCLANNDFSLAILHLQGSTEAQNLALHVASRDPEGPVRLTVAFCFQPFIFQQHIVRTGTARKCIWQRKNNNWKIKEKDCTEGF